MPLNSDPNCIFCKIVAGQIPSTQVHRDESVMAFNDIRPLAPTHILVIPLEHVTFVNQTRAEDEKLIGHMVRVGGSVAQKAGIEKSGYRISINQGRDAGQELDHLHLHVLGGRPLGRSA
ncbi:MAG: histidine triad nucleotide-binding protein [Chloroflexi bacterium]|nr:histidine triad nucleotide-binding protein [Chloroflexota bacterium]